MPPSSRPPHSALVPTLNPNSHSARVTQLVGSCAFIAPVFASVLGKVDPASVLMAMADVPMCIASVHWDHHSYTSGVLQAALASAHFGELLTEVG